MQICAKPKTTIMKNFLSICLALCGALLLSSCDMFLLQKTPGAISIHFAPAGAITKSAADIPDTNDFILSITDASGKSIYNGKFGDSPQKLPVDPGSYTVCAKSCEFDEPLFDKPQYGDEQVVVVSSGKTSYVELECSQMNSGVRIKTGAAFRSQYPDGTLYLKSADGRLMYGYAEKRTAFFKPGTVSLELASGSTSKTLVSRRLEPCQILTLSINSSLSSSEADGIGIRVDTARVWINESWTFGEGSQGEEVSNALSVEQAKARGAADGVWVYGYIVGISTSTSKSVFEAPFTLNTNILLASRSRVSDRSECLSVELPKGDTRDALNLKDNPGNLGKQVFVRGNLAEAYYGLPGLKSCSKFQWK